MSVSELGSERLYDLATSSGIGSIEEIPVRDGTYVRWAVGGGLEAWIRLGPSRAPTGHTIHLAGPARSRIQVLERQPGAGGDVLAGAFRGRPAGEPDFAFDSPDFRRHDDLELPAELDVQLAAVAAIVDVIPVEIPGRSPFLPGSSPHATDSTNPSAVTLAGRALRAQTRPDPIGDGTITWLLVGTPGGAVDVVIPAGLDIPEPGDDRLVRVRGHLSGLIRRPGPGASLPRARRADVPRNRHDRPAG